MAGSIAGGQKTAATLRARYGESYWHDIGRKGGAGKHKLGSTAGFQNMTPEQRSEAGRKGGENRRGWRKSDKMGGTWETNSPSLQSSNSTSRQPRSSVAPKQIEVADNTEETLFVKLKGFSRLFHKPF